MKPRKFSMVFKVILFQVVFLLLHYLYEWVPNGITAVFSGIDESVYQHLKIGFFSYLLVALIEYLWLRKGLEAPKRFLVSRLFTCVYYPWVMMVFFLVSPLIFIKIESIPGEIIFANVALLLTTTFSLIVERHVEKAEPTRGFTAVLAALFLIALVQFVVFTNRLPWFDIFARPAGW